MSQSGYLPQAHGGNKGLHGRAAICKDSVHCVLVTHNMFADTHRHNLGMVSILMEDFLM